MECVWEREYKGEKKERNVPEMLADVHRNLHDLLSKKGRRSLDQWKKVNWNGHQYQVVLIPGAIQPSKINNWQIYFPIPLLYTSSSLLLFSLSPYLFIKISPRLFINFSIFSNLLNTKETGAKHTERGNRSR